MPVAVSGTGRVPLPAMLARLAALRLACDIGGDCLARYFVRGCSKPRLSAIVNASRTPESEEPAPRASRSSSCLCFTIAASSGFNRCIHPARMA
jgi:hypothetical protein